MPKTTVAAIITKDDKKSIEILLTKRNIEPFKNQWCLPGGHIDLNEPAKIAIIREVKEEVGVDYKCTFYKYFDEIIPENQIHSVVLVFLGQYTGEINKELKEVSDIGWFPLDKALTMNLAFKHNEIIKNFLNEILKTKKSSY